MSREQLLAIIVVIGMLAGAIQQFYALKSEVEGLKIRFDFVNGSWHAPTGGK